MILRPAVLEDAEAAARCQLDCWREAYGPLVDPDLLAARSDLDRRIESWRWFATHSPPRLLAVEGTQVVGFAAAGPGRDDDLDLDVELYAIYVRASAYGSGLGARLLAAAIADRPAYLWVFEANERAAAFYAKHRFTADGARKLDDSFGLWERRLRR